MLNQTNLQANVIFALNMRPAAVLFRQILSRPGLGRTNHCRLSNMGQVYNDKFTQERHPGMFNSNKDGCHCCVTGFSGLIGCRSTQLACTVANAPWKLKKNREVPDS